MAWYCQKKFKNKVKLCWLVKVSNLTFFSLLFGYLHIEKLYKLRFIKIKGKYELSKNSFF